jgi:hypothetical protein
MPQIIYTTDWRILDNAKVQCSLPKTIIQLITLCALGENLNTISTSANHPPIPSPFHINQKQTCIQPPFPPQSSSGQSSHTCFSPLAYTFPRGKWSQSGYPHRQKKLGSPRIILRAKYGIIGALMLGTGEKCRLANGILETTCRLARWQCSRYSSTTAKYEVRSHI